MGEQKLIEKVVQQGDKKITYKRCYQPRGEAESLQGVVRLKGASSDGTNLRVGEGSAIISFEKQKQCK